MKPKLPIEKIQAMAIDMGRRNFYAYCRFMVPKVYTESHTYLREMCDTLQSFINGSLKNKDGSECNKLQILCPPRHAKTLSIINLCQWALGHDPTLSIIAVSYNEALSGRQAKSVRNSIQERKATSDRLVFSDFFPNAKIKDGDASMQLWSLEGSHFSYLATSPNGSLTGLGCKLLIIDDLVKNWYEACNERILEEHWDFYNNTLLSRIESGGKQILVNTRWAERDLSGMLLATEPDQWHVVQYKACIDEEKKTMLAPDILSFEEYDRRRKTGDAQLIAANYQQEPFSSTDKLYPAIKTYHPGTVPQGRIEAYFDTADEGQDYLAGAVYVVSNNTAYITDLIYTQEPMEVTEGQSALMVSSNKCQKAWIESNNGGKGFARNVERICREISKYSGCQFSWFHQGQNKVARIMSNSTNVCNAVIMPNDWHIRWPEFYRHVTTAVRGVKWLHDDAFDLLTGIVEKSLETPRAIISKLPAGL